MKSWRAEDTDVSQSKDVKEKDEEPPRNKCKCEGQVESGKSQRIKKITGQEFLNRLLPSVGDAIFQPMSRDVVNRRRESENP